MNTIREERRMRNVQRQRELLESLNDSDLLDGRGEKYALDSICDYRDYGWSHALCCGGTWYLEIRNTGWFCETGGGVEFTTEMVDAELEKRGA